MSKAFDGKGDEVAEGESASVLAGKASAKVGFVGGVDGEGPVGGALGFEPFEDPSIEEGSERLHDIVGEGGGAFSGGVADAVEGIETDGKKSLEGLREEVSVGVVEQGVEAVVFGG